MKKLLLIIITSILFFITPSTLLASNTDSSLYPVVTKKQAISIIRKALNNHDTTIQFTIKEYIGKHSSMTPEEDLLYEAYGNIPDFYLEGNWFWYIGPTYKTDPYEDGRFSYSIDYKFTKSQSDAFEKRLRKVLKSLKLKGLSQKKKAIKIYQWITKKIKYKRVGMYENAKGAFSVYNALMKKKATCQGIACLYYRMLKDSGVDACFIDGISHGDNHAWVLVKIGNKWYNTDPTFDLGKNKKTFRYLFKTNKANKGHKRSPEYTTKEFVKDHPMGKKSLKYK